MSETMETLVVCVAVLWVMGWPILAWVRGDTIRSLKRELKASIHYGDAWRNKAEEAERRINYHYRPSDDEIERAVRNAGTVH